MKVASAWTLRGTADDIAKAVELKWPGVGPAMERARANVPFLKREIWPFQAAVLYGLVRANYSRPGAQILEIGTAWGYSAAVMAEAAPEAKIVTLNPKLHEVERARGHLAAYPNVTIRMELSWDVLAAYDGPALDMVFVDGDHQRVHLDFPWWDHLAVGGLMLFHDYSPKGSKRPCPSVYAAVNKFAGWLGRIPDILVMDYRYVGMAGFVRDAADKEWGNGR